MAEGIAPAKNKERLRFQDGNTVDIQKVIFKVNDANIWKDTAELSKRFKPTKAGMNDLWRFVKYRIRYLEDPDGVQYVKHPARLWKDRVGDCKSFTLFIVSILQNLGIRYSIRFTSYVKGSKVVTHVYPVAHLDNGETVIIDAVWYYFNSEKSYKYKEDFKYGKNKMAIIYEISGIEGDKMRRRMRHAPRSLEHTLRACVGSTQNISDAVLQSNDVTKMTEAEFYKFIGYSKVSGINAAFDNNRAFAAPTFNFDAASVHGFDFEDEIGNIFRRAGNGVKQFVKKAGNTVKDTLKKAGEALKKAWAKLTNWLFKGALQKAAPFFMFTFLKKGVSQSIARRVKMQNGILNFISKIAGIDRAKIDATLRAGIVKKYGKQPEAILNEAAKSTVAGVDGIGLLPAVMAAIPAIVEIVKKIAAFFKKSTDDVPAANADSASDLEALSKEAQATGVTQPGGAASDAGKVVVQPSAPTTPVVNPTAEQRETEANAPTAPTAPRLKSSGASSAATSENGENTEGGNDAAPTGESGGNDSGNGGSKPKGKDNTMLYAGIAAAVVLVLVMK